MEIYKLSNCDYFIYTVDSSVNVSTNPDTDSNGSSVYINGVDASVRTGLVEPFNKTVYVHFSPTTHGEKAINDSITITDSSSPNGKIDSYSGYEPELNTVAKYRKNIENTSYQLLRVNPKLTGNIKVVVDSESNLYLDTFKVSQALSQQMYRKIYINPDEYYGRTLMAKLKGMPSDDLYKIEDSCYELFASCSTLEEQYYDKYNSGVRTNNDHMYTENFAMLAPLKIKKILPDFFLIFKVKDYTNIKSNADRIRHFVENGEIVKVFDMREGTPIGKYIRNIYKHAKGYVGDIYTSYDYDSFNVYNGISLERGVVSDIYEATSLERQLKNQTAMNDWYTLGFQRNRIVSKDIVNFEFMFDDVSEKMFSLNTYFGLYVKLNGEEENFSVIDISEENVPVYDNPIALKPEFNPASDSNKSIIYGLSTPETFVRLRNNILSGAASSTMRDFLLKPYKCLYASDISKTPSTNGRKHYYVSFTLNRPLVAGEIFRIVQGKGGKKILQVVCSNYIDTESDTSNILHDEVTIDGSIFSLHSESVFGIAYEYGDERAAITQHIELLKKAFDSLFAESGFDAKCNVLRYDSLSIEVFDNSTTVDAEKFYFQKFLSNSGFGDVSVNIPTDDRIAFFEKNNIPTFEAQSSLSQSTTLYPNGFESLGNRVGTTIYFIPTYNLVCLDNDPTGKISPYKTVIHPKMSSEGVTYQTIGTVDVSTGDTVIQNRSLMGYDPKFPYVMNVGEYEFNKLYLYQNYPLNAGICTILSVKDFYTDVLDTMNKISTNPTETKISDVSGEYQNTDNAAGVALSDGTEESICDYIDKRETVEKRNLSTDYDVSTFLTDNVNNNHTKSDISLVSPYCCKWQSVGTNHVGKPIRVMFPYSGENKGMSSALVDSSSYFLGEHDASTFMGFVSTEYNRLPYNARFDSYTTANNNVWSIIGDTTIAYGGGYATLRMKFHDAGGINRIVILDPDFSGLFTKGYTTGISFYVRINPAMSYEEAKVVTAIATGGEWLSIREHSITKEWKKVEYSCPFPPEKKALIGQFCFQHKDESLKDEYLECDVREISFHINSNSRYEKYVNAYLSRMNHFDFRDYFLYGNGSIDDIFYSSVSRAPKFSKVYKYGTDSIEFVSGGIKLRISSSSRTTIDMSKYNDYSGIIICMDGNNPANNTPCEIIIDETNEQIAFIIYNGVGINQMSYPGSNSNSMLNQYYGIYHSSPISDTEKTFNSNGVSVLSIPNDASFNSDTVLMYGEDGLLVQSSPSIDNMSFDKDKNVLSMYNVSDPSTLYDSAYPEYISGNTIGSKIYIDSSILGELTTQIINNTTYKHNYINNCFIYSPGTLSKSEGVVYGDDAFTLGMLKSIINNFTLIVKSSKGVSDYSGQSDLLTVEIIDPITFKREDSDLPYGTVTTSGIVHPTFAEPVMVDVVNFNTANTSVMKDSSISCCGCNIKIEDVSNIRQTWLRKYLLPGGSLLKNGSRTTSINLLKNISPIYNCWEQDMFRVFSNDDTYIQENGVKSSYEKNTFFASRGLTLKSNYDSSVVVDTVVLTDWVNTVIDKGTNTITLNITDTLTRKILSEEGYTDNWNDVEAEDINMSKYIENSILKYFEINNYTKFVLMCDYTTGTLGLQPTADTTEHDVVNNIENELVYIDNKYYMIIKNLENHMYYASMIIPTM